VKRPRAVVVTAVAFVAGVGVDLLIGDVHYFPGYAATIGLVGCVVIVLASKWLGKALIQRPESHYPDDVPADLQEDLRG
jgi:peptidoglycan/LPS O-acetylase OafA/YrhL